MTQLETASEILRSHPLPMNANTVSVMAVGDLTGDGQLDTVIKHLQDDRIFLTACSHDGETLWSFDTGLPAKGGWDGNPHHCPFVCWDIDGDGNIEVAAHSAGDAWNNIDKDFYDVGAATGESLVILDGKTGAIKNACAWPAWCPRVMMTVAHCDGWDHAPSLVICDETYGREIVTVINGKDLSTRWRQVQRRPAGHNVDCADVDGDGKQEIIIGGICYNPDGSILWEAEDFGHTDMSKPAKINPDLPGLQTYYLVESGNPGVYVVDHQGKTLWKEDFRHAHFGWIGKQDSLLNGLQPHAAEDGRAEYGAQAAGMRESDHFPIYNHKGEYWCKLSDRQRKSYVPVAWCGDGLTDFIDRKQKRIVRMNQDGEETILSEIPKGLRIGRNLICYAEGDDQRESIITIDEETNELIVLRCSQAPQEKIIPKRSNAYRHDRSQTGSGYYMYCAFHQGWDH